MGQWLIADLSVLDVHFQTWMLLGHGCCFALVSLRLGNAIDR
jgi:hypothetical protein